MCTNEDMHFNFMLCFSNTPHLFIFAYTENVPELMLMRNSLHSGLHHPIRWNQINCELVSWSVSVWEWAVRENKQRVETKADTRMSRRRCPGPHEDSTPSSTLLYTCMSRLSCFTMHVMVRMWLSSSFWEKKPPPVRSPGWTAVPQPAPVAHLVSPHELPWHHNLSQEVKPNFDFRVSSLLVS